MADKSDNPDPKVMDVSHPSGGASSPAAAPSHKMVKEPGAEDKAPAAEPAREESGAPSTKGVRLEPLSKPEDLKPEAKAEPKAEETKTDADGDTSDDDLGSRDKLKDADQDEQQLIDKKAAERQANYDKIVMAKTYFLPINQVVRRRSKRVAVAGAILIVLLGLAWVDVSLDAGLITVPGVKAPTHFFSK